MSEGTRAVCSSNLFASLPRPRALDHIADLGFGYVDLWASPLICGHVDVLVDDPAVVRAELEERGLSAASMTVFLSTEQERARALGFAAELDARYVVVEPAPSAAWPETMAELNAGERLLAPPGGTLDAFVTQLLPYAEEAESLGLRVCVEVPHVATVIGTRSELQAFLDHPGSERLGLTFAPPHLALAEDPLLATVEEVADRIDMFYLWNVKPGYQGRRDGRSYGSGEQQLGPDGALPVARAASWLLEHGGDRDYVVAAHGTEGNPDGDAVARFVGRASEQLPEPLRATLRSAR